MGITEGSPAWQQRLAWNVLDSLLGPAFIAMPDDLSFCVLSQPVNCLLILIELMLSGWILSLKVQQILPVAVFFRFIWVLATGLQGGYCHYYSTDARGCRRQHRVLVGQAGRKHGAKIG